MSKIFGGSKSQSTSQSTSTSGNYAYPFIQQQYGNTGANLFNTAKDSISNELSGGFQGYRDKTGFDFFEKLGLDQIGGGFSGRGSFQSGAALKALANFENNLEKSSYDSYLDKLFQQAQLGLGAGSLVSGSGGYSTGSSSSQSTGKSSPGIGSFLGQIASGIASGTAASDRRLKTDIESVGKLGDLTVYRFRYIGDDKPWIGVMADEVAELRPDALGPVVDGYMTVNYDKLDMEDITYGT